MATHLSVKRIALADLHLTALPRSTQQAFLQASTWRFLTNTAWYLAGGTALALQVGHRKSVDLDFFLPKVNFQVTSLERHLLATKQWVTSFRQAGTLYGVFMKAKMSFIAYPFFQPSSQRLAYGTIRMLLPKDVAAMKIIAISQRGRKRDFIDLYWYCQHQEKLADVIDHSLRQYPGQENNLNHILRSLVYFQDADEDPMPDMYFTASWQTIKSFFKREVPRVTKAFYHI